MEIKRKKGKVMFSLTQLIIPNVIAQSPATAPKTCYAPQVYGNVASNIKDYRIHRDWNKH